MPLRQLAPVSGSRVKLRLLALLESRQAMHRRAASDMTRKLGERVDSEAAARECLLLRQMVRHLPDEGGVR